jgi:hypothetical protein
MTEGKAFFVCVNVTAVAGYPNGYVIFDSGWGKCELKPEDKVDVLSCNERTEEVREYGPCIHDSHRGEHRASKEGIAVKIAADQRMQATRSLLEEVKNVLDQHCRPNGEHRRMLQGLADKYGHFLRAEMHMEKVKSETDYSEYSKIHDLSTQYLRPTYEYWDGDGDGPYPRKPIGDD